MSMHLVRSVVNHADGDKCPACYSSDGKKERGVLVRVVAGKKKSIECFPKAPAKRTFLYYKLKCTVCMYTKTLKTGFPPKKKKAPNPLYQAEGRHQKKRRLKKQDRQLFYSQLKEIQRNEKFINSII